MYTNEGESYFLKMTWKFLALSLYNVPHLNRYSMHISDLTLNLGYPSLAKGYWNYNSCSQLEIAPLKNVWGKVMHGHALRGFDVPKFS